MKKNSAIIFGILVLIAGVGLLFYAFMPGLAVFTIPLWKWFLAAAMVYWLVKKIIFSKTLANRLSVFIPLGLAFILFESEIGNAIGKGPDFVNNWYIILAAALLDGAVWLIFRPKMKKFFSGSDCGGSKTITYGTGDSNGDPVKFKLGEHVYYIDASAQTNADLINQLGELNVYYQNTDTGDTETPLHLNLVNQMGETRVHIPRSWHVDLSTDVSMGEVHCRQEAEVTTRTIYVRVKNTMGEVSIVSDD